MRSSQWLSKLSVMRTNETFWILLRRPARALGGGLLVAWMALLAACGPSEPPRDPTGDVVTYRCADDSEFKVYFFAGSPVIRVELGEAISELNQVDSDLGIVYANEVMELTVLRDYATLMGSPRGDLTECEDIDQELFG